MDITPKISSTSNIIKSYNDDKIKINETTYQENIIITNNQVFESNIKTIEDINAKNLSEILKLDFEILLIGTGKKFQIINQKIKNEIKQQNPKITINEMDNSAAFRTFNFLCSDDRKVTLIYILERL